MKKVICRWFGVTSLSCITFPIMASAPVSAPAPAPEFALAEIKPKPDTQENEPQVFNTRLSLSGYCHPESSGSYQQITKPKKRYTSLMACIKDGNKLPKGLRFEFPEEYAASLDVAIQNASTNDEILNAAKSKERLEKEVSLGGWNMNLAIAFLYYGSDKFIDEVSIDTPTDDSGLGRVRVDRETNNQASLMYEGHYYATSHWGDTKIGWGPFFAVGLANQNGGEPFKQYGLGLMFGAQKEYTWNIGLGYYIDTDFKALRYGLQDGSYTEFTDPNKILRKRDANGWMLLLTANF